MDSWVVGQLAFWYTVREVKPAEIVDRVIDFWLDLVTPGRGAGESQWWQRAMRTLEQSSERAGRELDIRTELRQWDNEHPEIHHELIVRYLCGAALSIVATALYNASFILDQPIQAEAGEPTGGNTDATFELSPF
eukprot:CAMPEP_0172442356 /NCGR_PEP_ID=MMETSP1065-20121228/2813_1 /TAXON_ID=265537 /ORGANISM="Amphiprora paludosa, Strain CCMP125" /LENGTH=134 /DNA_ID=CAMNT_0013192193 /DNA_START=42 /DNA_END=447 /DNA_ORIENTATION=+